MRKPLKPHERYIRLNGDPHDLPAAASFFMAADVQAGAITAVVGAGLTLKNLGSESWGILAPIIGQWVPLYGYTRRRTDKRILDKGFSELEIETKRIDTCPDENTPPTVGLYGLKAVKVKQSATRDMTTNIVMGALAAAGLYALDRPDISFYAGTILALNIIPSFVREFSIARRFNKVAKGEWVIVDMPEPEKVPEAEPVFA
jgi:hypothetical protein